MKPIGPIFGSPATSVTTPLFGSPAISTNTPNAAITFGGLTGSLTRTTKFDEVFPTASDSKSKDKENVDATKAPSGPSPFANFSFGQGSVNNKSFSELFGNISSNKAESPIIPITVPMTTQAQSTPVESTLNKSIQDDEAVDHYEPTAQFEPVIPLPELIETKTGEENEVVKFVHRAKLFRFDDTTREWKERGIGEMKVLIQKDDPSKARLLMRREQIHKLCCNMVITEDMKFIKMNATNYSFYGQDFSENEMKTEKLAIKFKTSDLVESFVNAALDAQKNLGARKAENKQPENKKEQSKGFGDQFKPKSGSWSCDACYISNKADTIYCVACNSPKDNTVPKKDARSVFQYDSATSSTFSFGMPTIPADEPKGFGNQFKPKAGSWSCDACYISNKADTLYCVACDSPKDSTVPKKEAKSIFAPSADAPKFNFGIAAASGFTFGTAPGSLNNFDAATNKANVAPDNTKEAAADSTTGFSFDPPKSFSFGMPNTSSVEKTPAISLEEPPSSEKPGFNFVFKAKSPSKKSPGKTRNDSVNSECAEDEEESPEEENQTYFTPVIALPEKIDVKTGEEDEEVLYSHRAKLFRFVDKEWKERGLGDIKILKHLNTGKLR